MELMDFLTAQNANFYIMLQYFARFYLPRHQDSSWMLKPGLIQQILIWEKFMTADLPLPPPLAMR
jgi:hypothetical protein